MDLIDNLREAIRSYVLGELGSEPGAELETAGLAHLLRVYGNWRARYVSEKPRRVHYSTELAASPKFAVYRSALDEITTAIEAGSDITPYLSRRVKTAYEPTATRSPNLQGRKDLDLLVADWGIHHLHLSTRKSADGFVKRTDDLLFAAFTRDDAYLIGIFPHGDWTDLELLRVVKRNWPSAGILQPIKGLGLAEIIDDDKRRSFRNAGLVSIVDIDGELFTPAGQTTAGTPIRVSLHVQQIINNLNVLDHMLEDNPQLFRQFLRQAGVDPLPEDNWKPIVRGDLFGFIEPSRQIFCPIGSLVL
ncbi:MAG TPA: hypothetical protein VGH27_23290 [Streptosporangiaceae bacterium]|jgi:hypothetical protein